MKQAFLTLLLALGLGAVTAEPLLARPVSISFDQDDCNDNICVQRKDMELSDNLKFVALNNLNKEAPRKISAMLEYELVSRPISREALVRLKGRYLTTLSEISSYDTLGILGNRFINDVRTNINRLDAGSFMGNLVGLTDAASGLGQDQLAGRFNSILSEAAPQTGRYLESFYDHRFSRETDASLRRVGLDPSRFESGNLDSLNGSGFPGVGPNSGIGIRSRLIGLRSAQYSWGGDSQWTPMDRLMGAVKGAVIYGSSAAGAGFAVGAALGTAGGPLAPATMSRAAVAGGAIGATAGAIYGICEGATNPLNVGINPSGTRITTTTTIVKDETTKEVKTTTTKKTEDLKTGKVDEVTTVTTKKEEECTGSGCAGNGGGNSNDSGSGSGSPKRTSAGRPKDPEDANSEPMSEEELIQFLNFQLQIEALKPYSAFKEKDHLIIKKALSNGGGVICDGPGAELRYLPPSERGTKFKPVNPLLDPVFDDERPTPEYRGRFERGFDPLLDPKFESTKAMEAAIRFKSNRARD